MDVAIVSRGGRGGTGSSIFFQDDALVMLLN